MSKDRIKPILDELGIKPTDNWQTIHVYRPNENDTCYYYAFEHKGKTYCVSGDSYSLVFSKDNPKGFFPKMLYQGYNLKELREAIKKVVSKWNT